MSDQTIDLLQRRLADPAQRETLIRDWLRDRLPPPLADAFEERLIEDPTLADDVELAKAMSEALRSNASIAPASAVEAPQKRGVPVRRFAAAAAMTAAIATGWLAGRTTSSGVPAPMIASPDRYVFDELRGANTPPLVILGRADAGYVIADFSVPEGAEAIELRIGGRTSISLQRSSEGFATALIPRDMLQPGVVLDLQARVAGVAWSRSHVWTPRTLGD